MVKVNTSPAAVTTSPVLPMDRMMPVFRLTPIFSLKWEISNRL